MTSVEFQLQLQLHPDRPVARQSIWESQICRVGLFPAVLIQNVLNDEALSAIDGVDGSRFRHRNVNRPGFTGEFRVQ